MRLSPETYKPIQQFRFRIIFSVLNNISIYGHAATLPSVDNSPQTIEYGNTYIKIKGKTKWNDITFTCYAFEGLTIEELFNYLNSYHQEISIGVDSYPDDYKKDIQIQLLEPNGDKVVGTWKLIGAFIGSMNFGQLDWANEEPVKPEITIAYDYAEYKTKE